MPLSNFQLNPTTDLNIRQPDGTGFEARTELHAGDQPVVLEDATLAHAKLGIEGQWIRIRTPNQVEGWVAAWFLKPTEASDAVLQSGGLPAPFSVTPIISTLNVRSGDLTQLTRLTTVAPSVTLEVLENPQIAFRKIELGSRPVAEGGERHWVHVRTPNQIEGWAAAWLLKPAPGSEIPDPLPEREVIQVESNLNPTDGINNSLLADEDTRVRTVAFEITTTFEGGSFASFQNIDDGIISFGKFQFTLQSGILGILVSQYIERSASATAQALNAFSARLQARDESLRDNTTLEQLLKDTATDPIMQQLQLNMAIERFWKPIHTLAIDPRGLKHPLTRALLFDIALNFGMGDKFVRNAENEFHVPERSRIGENGVTEEQLITRVAALRKKSHDLQAEADNLPGLKVRGNFWVDLVNKGDWQLQGDAEGIILVKGRKIKVRP